MNTRQHMNTWTLTRGDTSLLKRFLSCRGGEVWILFILWILASHRPPLSAISSLFVFLMADGQWTHCIKLGEKILLTGKTDGWYLTSVTTSGNFSFPLLLFPVTSRNKVLTPFLSLSLTYYNSLSLSLSCLCLCVCVRALVRVCLSHRQGNSAVIYMRTYFCLLIMLHEETDARHKSYKTCGVFVLYLLYPSLSFLLLLSSHSPALNDQPLSECRLLQSKGCWCSETNTKGDNKFIKD